MSSQSRQNAVEQLFHTQSEPRQPSAQLEAITHLKAGRLDEACALFEQEIERNPDNWQSIHLLGLVAYRQGQPERAMELIRHCLTLNPGLAEGYSDLGVILKETGELDDAAAACEKAISLKPDFHPAYNNLGNIFKALRKLDDAAECYQRAIELSPDFIDAHANLGGVLLLLDRKEDALDQCLKAVEMAPKHPDALAAFAQALLAADEIEDAITICKRAIELRPNHGPGYSDLGCILHQDGQFDEAIRAHKRAIELKPDYAEAHNNLGIVYKEMGRYPEALEAYKSALSLKPDFADAYSNMGVVLGLIGEKDDALRAYRRALEIDENLLVAYINLAGGLSEKDQLAEATATYAKALTIDPDHAGSLVDYYQLRRLACDWDGLAAIEEKILTSTYRKGKRVASFPVLNMSGTAEDHLLSAREWAKGIKRPARTPFVHAPPRGAPSERRLRIGYLSNDFYRHATSSLIAEMIETHDRSRFEIFGYCFTKDDSSAMRRRLISAFDHFTVIGNLPHAEAASRINQDEIDILIDLKGYTTGTRAEIVAHRPAPIQVNYLGYPGPMGADFIDYIIADEFILPMDQQPFYDEKIVQLPGCYQPNDSKRPIAERAPTRAECGLPETGFVFCSFNSSYKISPEIFGVWMRLLQNVPGSVLWLLESNALMRENLQRKAVSYGVDPARLVFAPKLELPAHLARHRNADLFLDSMPVNAHTTASDALWAGLPVLTCAGETLVSRVCASLLRAVGLNDLVTYSLSHYEKLALSFAENPESLKRLREGLLHNIETAPLFDTKRYTEGFEAALEHMAELRERGHEPRAFAVSEVLTDDRSTDDRPDQDESDGALPFSYETDAPVSALPIESPIEQETDFASGIASETVTSAEPAGVRHNVMARIAYEACPICEGADVPVFKTADCSEHPLHNPALPATMSWCQCGSCGHVFTDGYFSEDAQQLLLAQPVLHHTVGHDAETQRFISSRIIGQIAKLKPGGDWLDVGVGDASLLFTAEEWGYNPVGLDWRQDNVAALEKLGYEVYGCPLDELDMPGRFNAVSMSDVLQQMPQPRMALSEVKKLLRPGGILFCTTPNMASIVWRIMDAKEENPYWGEIEHYHNFTRDRLYRLLEETGFRPVFYNVSERYRACMDVIAMSE